ncbi:dihydrodipicolinate synthase family protein, partial [Streptomyces sp. NPDC079189]|uniref:dihydrodipicolinate synthase family protein n=1 Tax=Streptomyces sp. NPDC079189 TaxID=3154514 RepID=UPI0034266A99
MVDNLSSGVWGVVATPFLGSALQVDETSLSRLVKHYEGIGVTGLTVLGVFGEAARLSAEERRTVLEVVAASVELPLVVGVTGLATAPVIEEARLVREVVGDRLAGRLRTGAGHRRRRTEHDRPVLHLRTGRRDL